MAKAVDQFMPIGGCGPQIILGATIMRLAAASGIPAGGAGTDGTDYHFLYQPNPSNQALSSQSGSSAIQMEFDPPGLTLLLPAPGNLQLVGGNHGNYFWDVRTNATYGGVYIPEWRALQREIDATDLAKSFTIPIGHSRIGSLNATVTVVKDGIPCDLDGTPKPCRAGQIVTVPMGQKIALFTEGLL